jgi:hypothetical protein
MVPGSGTDLAALSRQYMQTGASLDVPVMLDALQDNNGFASAIGSYAGPVPYTAGDCPDTNVIPVLGRKNHAFQVVTSNTLSYSVQAEGSLDGLNWKIIGAAVSADGITQFTGLFKYVRFHLTAWAEVASPTAGIPVGVSVRYLATQ